MSGVMLDLETLGNRPGSVILAIGAVRFGAGRLGEEFYTRVDPQSCIDAGLQMDVSTVMWWMQQSDEARAEVCREGIPLPQALGKFTAWLLSLQESDVWGNGASFDNTVLVAAYRACRMELPWPFWRDRCYRTAKALHPHVRLQRSGTHHNALDDAKTQALHLMEILASGRKVSA
jgi:hypothetical protein